MSLPRYPEYKDSGAEWLGEVPAHWQVMQLRYVCKCLDSSRIPLNSTQRAERQGDVPYWGANAIMDYVDEALFDEELILLGEDGAPFFDRNRPVAFFTRGRIWPNNHVHVLRPIVPSAGKFIVHALNSTDYTPFVDGSTRDKLTQRSMNSISIAWPGAAEQIQIAEFLDRETAKIDELVAEQQRLIDLLKEKRQATISHVVTKGLNPNAPMRDSGIEWLGEVPAHWTVLALRRCLNEHRQGYYSGDPYVDAGVKLLRITDLRPFGRVDTNDCPQVEEREEIEPFLLKKGDFVFARTGGAGLFGLVENLEEPVAYASYLIRFRFSDRARPDFLRHYLLSNVFQDAVKQNIHGGVNQNIHAEDIKNQHLALPPDAEQAAIAAFLDRETSKFETLTCESLLAIDLLQERRSALISAAVTGQIDVRPRVQKA